MKRTILFISLVLFFTINTNAFTTFLSGATLDPDNNYSVLNDGNGGGIPVEIFNSSGNRIVTVTSNPINGYWQHFDVTQAGPYTIKYNLKTFNWIGDRDGTYNVKDFGATGDGNTDDYTSIRSALLYVASQNGGKLIFPRGDYQTTGGFFLPSGIIIEGNSGAFFSSCRITLNATNKSLFEIGENVNSISFKDILLTTDSSTFAAGTKAILAKGAGSSSIGLVLRDMTVIGFEKGIDVDATDTSRSWQFDNIRLDHVNILQCKTCIELESLNTDWQISNSIISVVKDGTGIDIIKSGYLLIENTQGGGPSGIIGSADVGETFIHIGGEHGTIKIDNSQCEQFRQAIVADYEDYEQPLMITNSIFGDYIKIKKNITFVSSGNRYLSDTVQTLVLNEKPKFADGSSYDSYKYCATPAYGCCNLTATVPNASEGSAANVKIYYTGDSFSRFNRFLCDVDGNPSDFLLSGNSAVFGKNNTVFDKTLSVTQKLGVGTQTPGNGIPNTPSVLEIEAKDNQLPWIVLNRSNTNDGSVTKRWGMVVGSDGSLYFQDIGNGNKLQIDANGNLLPAADNTGNLGTDLRRWARVRASIVQSGDLILSDIKTGKKLYVIKEDENNIYFMDYRTGNQLMRLDTDGNLFLKGKVFEETKPSKKKDKAVPVKKTKKKDKTSQEKK